MRYKMNTLLKLWTFVWFFGSIFEFKEKNYAVLRERKRTFDRHWGRDWLSWWNKKVKAGVVSLDDLPLPVFETEEEKEKRLQNEAEKKALVEKAKGGEARE